MTDRKQAQSAGVSSGWSTEAQVLGALKILAAAPSNSRLIIAADTSLHAAEEVADTSFVAAARAALGL